MMQTEWDGLRVTDDPEIEARLRDRAEEMTSRELAEYAHSIGLYPPGFGPDMNPPITLVWLPDMSYDEDGIPMWDAIPDEDSQTD